MKSLFLLSLKSEENKKKFIANLKEKHGDMLEFTPVLEAGCKGENKTFLFTNEEAINAYLKDDNAFFEKILQKYEELLKTHSKVVVIGPSKIGFLNEVHFSLRIVKTLNTPFYVLCEENDKPSLNTYLENNLKNDFVLFSDEDETLPSLHEYDFLTPARFFYNMTAKLKKEKKTVVLPEANDERVLKAASKLQDLVNIILLGEKEEVLKDAAALGVSLDNVTFINPLNSEYEEEFTNTFYELRKHKGVDLEKARKTIKDRTFFGTMLVHAGKADAMVSGASTTTAETVRPALQIIKTKSGVRSVSGVFFMCLEEQVLVFADCAINPNPDAKTLAGIAAVSAQTAKDFGITPRVAILSYSTGESGSGKSVDDSKAVMSELRSGEYEDFLYEGPIQFDAAINAAVAKSKMPGSAVAGRANVFIFPDLNAANICYKAVQRTAGAIAVGPALQGLKKPVNDLSRGCLVEDIVQTVILSAVQAG